MTKRHWLWLVASLLIAVNPSSARTLEDEFSKGFAAPNAPVCVKFDAQGHILAVLVEGKDDDKELNSAMLTLLRSRHWDVPPASWVQKWVALCVDPGGAPVPEILVHCPSSG
jgi:hypothetical protein